MEDLHTLRTAARTAFDAGRWSDARARYAVLCARGECDFWDLHFLATSTLYTGDVESAERLLQRLREKPGDEGAVLVLRASVAEWKGEHRNAAALFSAARAAGASPYWTGFGECRALARLGQLRLAHAVFAEALRDPHRDAQGLHYALELDLKLGDSAAADRRIAELGLSRDETDLARLAAVPGMTWPKERVALRTAARRLSGDGAILDLGCFLGSLTCALACGLQSNGPALARGRRVHAFDSFRWYGAIMDQFWHDGFPGALPAEGASFLPVFQHWTAPWANLLVVHEGDLLTTDWSEPIELLSIDAMKSVPLSRHIIATFLTPTIRGAKVFHQDFCFDQTWWIPLFHYLLRDHFRVIDPLPGASGVLFEVVQPLTADSIARVMTHDVHDARTADRAFEFAIASLDPADGPALRAGHLRYYDEVNPPNSAHRVRALQTQYGASAGEAPVNVAGLN